jgi:hypothetical protein
MLEIEEVKEGKVIILNLFACFTIFLSKPYTI